MYINDMHSRSRRACNALNNCLWRSNGLTKSWLFVFSKSVLCKVGPAVLDWKKCVIANSHNNVIQKIDYKSKRNVYQERSDLHRTVDIILVADGALSMQYNVLLLARCKFLF